MHICVRLRCVEKGQKVSDTLVIALISFDVAANYSGERLDSKTIQDDF